MLTPGNSTNTLTSVAQDLEIEDIAGRLFETLGSAGRRHSDPIKQGPSQ